MFRQWDIKDMKFRSMEDRADGYSFWLCSSASSYTLHFPHSYCSATPGLCGSPSLLHLLLYQTNAPLLHACRHSSPFLIRHSSLSERHWRTTQQFKSKTCSQLLLTFQQYVCTTLRIRLFWALNSSLGKP